MEKRTQQKMLNEIEARIDANEAAEIIVDLYEGWATNPENNTATVEERSNAIFVARFTAKLFRQLATHATVPDNEN